jgi:hypothetical protein
MQPFRRTWAYRAYSSTLERVEAWCQDNDGCVVEVDTGWFATI